MRWHLLSSEPWTAAKKVLSSVGVPPVPVRDPSRRPLAPSVTSVANDKSDNEMIPGAVHRSPGICLTAKENLGKLQLGDLRMEALCDQSSPQMGSLTSAQHVKREGRREGKDEEGCGGILILILTRRIVLAGRPCTLLTIGQGSHPRVRFL